MNKIKKDIDKLSKIEEDQSESNLENEKIHLDNFDFKQEFNNFLNSLKTEEDSYKNEKITKTIKENEIEDKVDNSLYFYKNKLEMINKMKESENMIISEFNNFVGNSKIDNSRFYIEKWEQLQQLSQSTILKLTENLKAILEPNKMNKLQGNYKSGKRLNLRKIISFIASNYKNDKIWLKRTLPHDRNYLVSINIDDSLSMKEGYKSFFAMETLSIVATSLKKAGIGKLSIGRIRETLDIVHSYSDELTREKGGFLLSQFTFNYSSSTSHEEAMCNFLKQSMTLIEENSAFNNKINEQIHFIISDGIFNKDVLRPYYINAKSKGILYVFIILDQHSDYQENIEMENNEERSILKMTSIKQVEKNGEVDFEINNYLDDFPFEEFVVLKKSKDLPSILNELLVKWISLKMEN